MSTQVPIPLSTDELAELDEFLLADTDERLSIDEAHGFLTALVVGHDNRGEEGWLVDVWGDSKFADDTQRQRMTELLLRMRADITAMLTTGQRFEPLILEEEDEDGLYEVYDGWCFGFMLAVANDDLRWQDLPNDQEDLLEPIASLALLHTDDAEEDMSEDEYSNWAQLLPGSVMGLYSHFTTKLN